MGDGHIVSSDLHFNIFKYSLILLFLANISYFFFLSLVWMQTVTGKGYDGTFWWTWSTRITWPDWAKGNSRRSWTAWAAGTMLFLSMCVGWYNVDLSAWSKYHGQFLYFSIILVVLLADCYWIKAVIWLSLYVVYTTRAFSFAESCSLAMVLL